jgi:hypothetical protein
MTDEKTSENRRASGKMTLLLDYATLSAITQLILFEMHFADSFLVAMIVNLQTEIRLRPGNFRSLSNLDKIIFRLSPHF